jgi:hypothetical protein
MQFIQKVMVTIKELVEIPHEGRACNGDRA